ncbi:BGTF surface domain-containing protein [Natrarchaeobaculum aegyptiacum]|uniref:PGF-CTERM archaeal protein-sorting signal domain-containing protein n=1 Tax=Natrarchaeobaculum aegyptiacum TaxID=745377 RepID=A0A2Z2HS44_9EURY|nr:BGTF surface domain-containing protein [Natrarchaeobaculum aegyptiacum]ARS89623.1 hypothetical protein B1756_07650 [Natrarchaeobaculum aegyptiacum]
MITERTDVAEDDRLIIEVEASGIFGFLADNSSNDFDIVEDGTEASALYHLVENSGEGVNFEVEADDGIGNQEPTALELETEDEGDIFVLIDNDEGVFYVVVDTSSGDAFDGDLEDGQDFDVEFEFETDDDDRYEFGDGPFDGGAGDSSGANADAAFPYLGTDSDQSVSTEFTIVEPAAEFHNLDADDNVQIEAGEDVVLTGETNVAPGSEGDVRVRNAGDTPSFLSTQDAEIDSDGTFETEAFDFGDRAVDDEAEINFRVGGSSVTDADGIFVEEVEDADDEPADDADDHEDDHADEPADEPADDGVDDEPAPADDTADDVEPEDDGVPGFGLAIAVVALLAAAMLALRRQN